MISKSHSSSVVRVALKNMAARTRRKLRVRETYKKKLQVW